MKILFFFYKIYINVILWELLMTGHHWLKQWLLKIYNIEVLPSRVSFKVYRPYFGENWLDYNLTWLYSDQGVLFSFHHCMQIYKLQGWF